MVVIISHLGFYCVVEISSIPGGVHANVPADCKHIDKTSYIQESIKLPDFLNGVW